MVVIGERELRVTVVRDITRRRQAEWELARLASFPRLDPNPLFECDAEGSVTYANPAALRLLQSLGGPEPAARLLPQNLPALVRACLGACDDRCQGETPVDGRTLLWALYALPESQRVRIYGVDITQRQRAQEALRESEEQYRGLVQTAQDAIFSLSEAGKFTSLNPAFEVITGWSPAECMGKDFAAIVHPDDVPFATKLFQQFLKGQARGPFELRVLKKSDGYVMVEITATPHDQESRVIGVRGIARDLTERKRLRLFESLLPVCCLCGKVRDDTKTKRGHGRWRALEEYVVEHSDADLTHTFCPDCYRTYREREGLPPAEPPEG